MRGDGPVDPGAGGACPRAARPADQQPAPGRGGVIPIVVLSPDWERHFADALTGPPEDRQLAMAPSLLSEFMARVRAVLDARRRTG